VCSESDRASEDRRQEREGSKSLALTSTALTPVPHKRQVVKDVFVYKVDSKFIKWFMMQQVKKEKIVAS